MTEEAGMPEGAGMIEYFLREGQYLWATCHLDQALACAVIASSDRILRLS